MDKQLLLELLKKYEAGLCTEEEAVLLETWYLQWKPNSEMVLSEALIQASVDNVWRSLQDTVGTERKIINWPRIAAAAAILLFFGIGAYIYRSHKVPGQAELASKVNTGGNRAVLTLDNGIEIDLSDKHAGTVAKQAGVSIRKTANGELVYTADQTENGAGSTAYNNVSTPMGGQYQVILPDGSHVWLNAASSIRYPTIFGKKERLVKISGEVYFEVAKNPELPFRVSVNGGTEIRVLGTHFNVNAYKDEPFVHTTLAEGSIRLNYGDLNAILSPGQGAMSGNYTNGAPYLKKDDGANVAQAMAWKEGLFNFQDMPFGAAMRELSRWYNIDVVYEDGIPDMKFAGELGRDVSFTKILFFLSKVNIHYRMEQGNRLVITK